jgi:hypothetical protein
MKRSLDISSKDITKEQGLAQGKSQITRWDFYPQELMVQ